METAFDDSPYSEARLRKLLAFQHKATASEDFQATLVEELFSACKRHRTAFKGGSLCRIYNEEWPAFMASLAASEGVDDFEDLPTSLRMKAFIQLLLHAITRSGDDKETIALKEVITKTESRYTSDKAEVSSNRPQKQYRKEVCRGSMRFIYHRQTRQRAVICIITERVPADARELTAREQGAMTADPQSEPLPKTSFDSFETRREDGRPRSFCTSLQVRIPQTLKA